AMVRRSAFDAVGGFDERLQHAEDYDLWLRLARAGPIEHVARTLVAYRLHAGNLSHDREALRRAEVEILNNHAIDDIREALLVSCAGAARADVALSRVLFRMERYEEGEAVLRDARAAEADRALRCFLLGNFALKRGDLAAAAVAFTQCLQQD